MMEWGVSHPVFLDRFSVCQCVNSVKDYLGIIPDKKSRVCLTSIFARGNINPQLMDTQGRLTHDTGDNQQHPSDHCHF